MRSLFSLSFRERFFLLGLFGFLFLGLFVLLTMGLIGEFDLNTGGIYCLDRQINEDPQLCDRDYRKIILHHLEMVGLSTVIVVLPAVAFVYLCLVACHFVPPRDGRRDRATADEKPPASLQGPIGE